MFSLLSVKGQLLCNCLVNLQVYRFLSQLGDHSGEGTLSIKLYEWPFEETG